MSQLYILVRISNIHVLLFMHALHRTDETKKDIPVTNDVLKLLLEKVYSTKTGVAANGVSRCLFF